MTIAGAQVKAARLLLGWSQSKLATETGVTAVTIACNGSLFRTLLSTNVRRPEMAFVEGECNARMRVV